MRCVVMRRIFRKQKRPPISGGLYTGDAVLTTLLAVIYQDLFPWQELEQERVVAFQPMVVARFLAPLLCVVALTVVVL